MASDANNSAKAKGSDDSRSASAQCKLKQHKLQLIPVVYSLVEKTPEHPAINSRHHSQIKTRPVGIRPIREDGYIYLIHSNRTDIIYVYKVKKNGAITKLEQEGLSSDGKEYVYEESQKGIFVEQCGHIDVLYSRTKISPKLQTQLLKSSELRDRMMQKCSIYSYTAENGARHLLPPKFLKDNLADCHPKESDGSDNKYNVPWLWNDADFVAGSGDDSLPEYTYSIPSEFDVNTILNYRNASYENDYAILILEDTIGHMDDLANVYAGAVQEKEDWLKQDNDGNRAKYFAASQLKLLMNVGNLQFKANTVNKKIIDYSQQYPQELTDRYNQYYPVKEKYDRYHNPNVKTDMSLTSEGRKSAEELALQNEKNKLLADKIGVNYHELERLFIDVRTNNKQIVGGSETLFSFGIKDFIDQDSMDSWLMEVQPQLDEWHRLINLSCDDRIALLDQAYFAIPVFDKENKQAFIERLKRENSWLLGLDENDSHRKKLTQFYLEQVGEQNLHTYVSNQSDFYVYLDYSWAANEWNNLAPVAAGSEGAADSVTPEKIVSSVKDYENALMLKGGLNTASIDDAVIQYHLSLLGHFWFKLGLAELQTRILGLQNAHNLGDKIQSVINYFTENKRPGSVTIFCNQMKNAAFEFDIANPDPALKSDLNKAAKSGIEAMVADQTMLKTQEEKRTGNTTANERRTLDNKISRASQKRGAARTHFVDTINQYKVDQAKLLEEHSPLSKGTITVTAGGATKEVAEQIMADRKQILRNEFIWGNAEGEKAFDGQVKGGSIAFCLSILSFWNLSSTLSSLAKESGNHTALEYIANGLVSDILGAVTAVSAVSMEVVNTAITLIHINKGISLSKAYGMLSTYGSGALMTLSSFTYAFNGGKQFSRLKTSVQNGEWGAGTGAAIALAGDVLGAGVAGRSAYIGFKLAGMAMSKAGTEARMALRWGAAGRLATPILARMNIYFWIADIAIFIGDLMYSYFRPGPFLTWVKHCVWGKDKHFWDDNQHWDFKTQYQQYQEVIYAPQMSIHTVETTIMSIGSLSKSVEKVDKLKFFLPMPDIKRIRVAGCASFETFADYKRGVSRGVSLNQEDVTESWLTKYGVAGKMPEGIVYEVSLDEIDNLRADRQYLYIDILLEVTDHNGTVFYSDQKGTRFTVNLDEPTLYDEVSGKGNKGWRQVNISDSSMANMLSNDRMAALLKEVKPQQKLLS